MDNKHEKEELNPCSSLLNYEDINVQTHDRHNKQLACRVCGRPAPNKEPPEESNSLLQSKELKTYVNQQRVYLCVACKKFYTRSRNKLRNEKCQCRATSNTCRKCRICRFRRFEAALVEKKAKSTIKPGTTKAECEIPLDKIDLSKLPCTICGCSSSGYHFGAISCEGCKGFFCRSMRRTYKLEYMCKKGKQGSNKCPINALCPSSSNCRKCRFQRCLDAGMSLKGTSLGRHAIRRQFEIEAAIRKHFADNSLLKGRVYRRTMRLDEEKDDMANVYNDFMSSNRESLVNSSATVGCDEDHEKPSDPAKQDNFHPSISGQSSMSKKDDLSTPTTFPESGAGTTNNKFSGSNSDFSSLDKFIQESSDWFIEQAVEAAARLSTISTIRVYFTYEMTLEERVALRSQSMDNYAKCISEFIVCLPGIAQISVPDRIRLFAEACCPISIAQLSLDFDFERQIPNNFSLDRSGPSWEICATTNARAHYAIERFLCEAGNKFNSSILNLKEFALCCALLFLNPEAPNLENVASVRSLRRRYDLAVLHLFSADDSKAGARMEERLCQFYGLVSYLRQSTTLIQNIFTDVAVTFPQLQTVWTPLFRQLFSQIINLPKTFYYLPQCYQK